MSPFRTSFRLESTCLTLPLSGRDLQAMMDHGFTQVLGTFQNHSVARGQDTDAWVVRERAFFIRETERFRQSCENPSASLVRYIRRLEAFLGSHDDEAVHIRHHYAWWYPKWFDMFMASN
jgi:hypothetical protein